MNRILDHLAGQVTQLREDLVDQDLDSLFSAEAALELRTAQGALERAKDLLSRGPGTRDAKGSDHAGEQLGKSTRGKKP